MPMCCMEKIIINMVSRKEKREVILISTFLEFGYIYVDEEEEIKKK